MDKYEFNLKIEQLKKLINEEDYLTALKIVESIDWNRVRNTNLLTTAANVYEKNDMLQEAKDMLILAFERAPVGKHILFKLTELSCRTGDLEEAEDYYHEFRAADATDIGNYTLQYMILKARHAPYDRQLMPLERYCEIDPDEKWLYELAEVYEYANRIDDCIRVCDRLALLYGGSKFGLKALRLKSRYAALTDAQRNILYPRSTPVNAENANNGYADGNGSQQASDGSAQYDTIAQSQYGGAVERSQYDGNAGYAYNDAAAPANAQAAYNNAQSGPADSGYTGYADSQAAAADSAVQQAYAANGYIPQTGVYDDRDYNAAAQQTAQAAAYAYTEEAEPVQGSSELNARKSDALAAERYAGEDEAFDAYVRMCASDEGRPAAAKVEVINGTANVQTAPQPAPDEGVQMTFDFGGDVPRVVDEVYSQDEVNAAKQQAEAVPAAPQQLQSQLRPDMQPQTTSPLAEAAGLTAAAGAAVHTASVSATQVSAAAAAAGTAQFMANAAASIPAQAVSAPETASIIPQAAETSSQQTANAVMPQNAVPQNAMPQTAQPQRAAANPQAVPTQNQNPAAAQAPVSQMPTQAAAAPQMMAQQSAQTQAAQPQSIQPQAMQAAPQAQTAQASTAQAQTAQQLTQQAAQSPLGQAIAQQPTQRPLVPHQQLKSATPVKGLHMIVEAATAEDGLGIAIDELKNIHEEKGIEHASVKTSAEKLNKNGISEAIISKVSGKDFVIEHAGALSEANVDTIYRFICSDKTGTIVVLIDTPDGLDRIEELQPKLFDICDYISDIDDEEDVPAQPELRVENGVTSRQTHPGRDDDDRKGGVPYDDAADDDEPYDESDDTAYDDAAEDDGYGARGADARSGRSLPKTPEISEDRTPVKRSNGKVTAERFNNVKEINPAKAGQQMEIDDFAQYCAQYAASIDCSITGTSMLALYERIELMEENDIPLTKANAEQLIEEAADRAEKPPIGKRLTGLFKSKYDKNGLLILKEDDFIY